MASSITIKSDAYKTRYMQLVCEQTIDVANNKSIIKWTLSSVGGEVNYYSTGPTSVFINGTCVYYKDRVSYTAEVFPAAKGSVSGTIEVSHNEDGTKGVTVLLNTVIYQGSSKVKGYSSWWVLDPIQRNAKLSDIPSVFSGKSLPTIKYWCPSSDTIAEVAVCIADSKAASAYVPYTLLSKTGTTFAFSGPQVALLDQHMPSNDYRLPVTFVLRTTTTSGNTYWDYLPSTYEMLESEDTVPTVTMTLSPLNPSSIPSALASEYIQGKSGVTATISASCKYGATISNLYVEASNAGAEKFYTPIGSSTGYNQITDSITTEAITTSGSIEVIGSAKDSRQFTGEAKQTISVLEYSKPLVVPCGGENAILCYRSTENGDIKSSSPRVWIKAKRSYYNLAGRNGCVLQWRRKLSAEVWDSNNPNHDWHNLLTSDATADEYNAIVGEEFIITESYAVQIRALDDLGEFDVKDIDVPTQDVALHLGAGGKNVTVGDYCDKSEEYTFRSAWKAIFDNGIYGTLSQHQYISDVYAFAIDCQIGFTPFSTKQSTANIPPVSGYNYSSGFVCKRTDKQMNVILFCYLTCDLAINTYLDGEWQGWKYIHTTST